MGEKVLSTTVIHFEYIGDDGWYLFIEIKFDINVAL